ncbi:alpha/beta fold hydrolase [Aquimarina muelleri]|uniref:Proline iminopeptidase n=1 Tax=Aquimarina muelleri TaxID=279356 RepID=A0A918JTK3_9FLAO|nr:alpha/beta fold hydrolase [Aquimarina muelleri]MCX2761571.1 alpha/beta fold hydrolase [Aquimarina muelleri]GGX07804.1 proline iminopeptidase [Aquimarina muelleri]
MKTQITFLFISFVLAIQVKAQETTIHDQFEPKFININGYQINVETKGKGNPIVFIAGGPGNSHDYLQGNFGKYHTSAQVVFFDGLGRGLSEDAKDKKEYSIQGDVETLEGIRKALELPKWTLVGHSYGTVVAQAYAIKYPQYTEKMVLINGFHSGLMWQANCDSYNHYAKTHFPEKWKAVDSLRAVGYVSSDPEFLKVYGDFPTKYIYYHNTELNQPVPKNVKRSWNLDVYYNIVGRDGDFHVTGDMGDTDFRRKLKEVKSPTLVIAGRYDGVSTPEFAIQYKTYMPQAEFVMFEKSGHNPYLEEPEKFFKLFEQFLSIKK